MQSNKIPPLSKDRLFNWLTTLSNQLSKGTFIIDIHNPDLPILHVNAQALQLTNYEMDELIGQNLTIFNGARTNHPVASDLLKHIKLGISYKCVILHYAKHGIPFWHAITVHPIIDENENIQYALLTCEDATDVELNKMVYKLEHEVYVAINHEDNLQSILSLIAKKIEQFYIYDVYCMIQIFDKDARLKAVGTHTLPEHFIENIDLLDMISHNEYNPKAIFITNVQQSDSLYRITDCWTKPIFMSNQNIAGLLTLFLRENFELRQSDINYLNRLTLLIQLAVKYTEQKLELRRMAYYDMETNLPNIHYFKTALNQWIDNGDTGYVSMIHPSQFSKIVDLYGRQAGAELLSQLVARLKENYITNNDLIARFSNSIIFAKKGTADAQSFDYPQIETLTKAPFIINGTENYITLKIGYTLLTHGLTVEEVVHQADIALTKSSKNQGTNFELYEENSTQQLLTEMNIFNQLSYGIKNQEFEVHLQPKVNFETIEVEGFEALARWNSSKLGFVSPLHFIPIAEQSGKVKDIDLLNLKLVLQWLQQRLNEGKKVVPVSINISPAHFYEPYFLENILATFQQFNVPAKYIKLEVTESMELIDFQRAKAILEQLNAFGIESSIDDFGVGFSSLSYLPKLPFSEIKIDRSFINSMDEPGMQAIIKTIIHLAHAIDMRPIAEGIETKEQLTMLKHLGCPAGQGYYFYKPMKLEDADKLLDVQAETVQ